MAEVWNLPNDVKIPMKFNALGQPVGDEASVFANFTGCMARSHNLLSISYTDWRKVPNEDKEGCWQQILVMKFMVYI